MKGLIPETFWKVKEEEVILHNISTRYPNCLSPPVADAFSQITHFAQLQCNNVFLNSQLVSSYWSISSPPSNNMKSPGNRLSLSSPVLGCPNATLQVLLHCAASPQTASRPHRHEENKDTSEQRWSERRPWGHVTMLPGTHSWLSWQPAVGPKCLQRLEWRPPAPWLRKWLEQSRTLYSIWRKMGGGGGGATTTENTGTAAGSDCISKCCIPKCAYFEDPPPPPTHLRD